MVVRPIGQKAVPIDRRKQLARRAPDFSDEENRRCDDAKQFGSQQDHRSARAVVDSKFAALRIIVGPPATR
jgi:hypothetical protein